MRRATLSPAALALGMLAACTSGLGTIPKPPPTSAVPPTTTVADLSQVGLRPAVGRSTTTVRLGPGKASITGVVTSPEGPVGGAVVHLERIVDDSVGSADVVTNPDGTYAVTAVLGGRYRVRAFKPAPDNLAIVRPEIFFLGGDENKPLNLAMDRYSGAAVAAAIAPSPPVAGESANLVILVTQQSVDGKGIVRAAPLAGARVELFASGDWRVESTNAQSTDGAGVARWQVRCQSAGDQPIAVVVGDADSFPVATGPCAEAPPTTTTSSTPPSSSTSSSSTSSSTSTTRRPTTTTSR